MKPNFWIPTITIVLGLFFLLTPLYVPGMVLFMMGLSILFGYILCYIDFFDEIFFFDDKNKKMFVGFDLAKGHDYQVLIDGHFDPIANKFYIDNEHEYRNDEENCNEERPQEFQALFSNSAWRKFDS